MITVQKTDFLNAIKVVKTATAKQQLQPVLQAINLKTSNNGLVLTATDFQNTSRAIIEANIQEDMNICINAERLDGIISRLDEIITIEKKETRAIIKSGKTKFECLFIEGSEFPDVKIELVGEKIVMPTSKFIDGVTKTEFATQKDGNNIISGVCFDFDNKEIASTDGNRLCKVILNDVNGKGKYVIPRSALLNVAKLAKGELEIYFNDKEVIFNANNFIYITRLLMGNFPAYNQLFPQNFEKTIYFDKKEFLTALETVAIMEDNRTSLLKMSFSKDKVELFTQCSDGDAKNNIEVDYQGEDFNIFFNLRYMFDGIKAMESDVISLNINKPNTAVLFIGDYSYLIMPIQPRM